ncbi:MAG: metal ABC transporter substrate-binding protein [Dehalococcoidales bacterium]|nr:metal ABC transporter substrate-binding protein [Dehalococcoidales bacterium]
MKWKYILPIVVLIPVLFGAFSCQPRAESNKKSIVVTYSVLGSIVKELVGTQANVIISIPNGLDLHEWEPSAKDIEAINKADLVIENGLGLEGGLEKTLATARKNGVKFFTASDYITVRHVGAGEGIPSGDPDQVVGAPDPHLWTDPIAIKGMVNALAPALKNNLGLDVTSQAANLIKRLDNLDTELSDTLAVIPQDGRKLVTGHESMGYFAQRYGFKLVGVIIPSLSSQAQVSAADLTALKKAIEEYHVKAIFTELGTSPAVAKAIGDETGVQVVELATHTLPADGSYFTFMNNMANIITGALK